MAGDFDIRLLGRPWCRVSAVAGAFPSKGFQLLALLATSPARKMPRKEAAAMLWDAATETMALQNLRQLLLGMRRAFPAFDRMLLADRQDLSLAVPGAGLDLDQFQAESAAEDEASLERALALYGGELLAGVSDITQAFSLWLLQERSRLKEDYFAAFARYLPLVTRHGPTRADQLRRVGVQATALEPEREETYRQLIDAFGRMGLSHEVERTYRILLSMVKREYGAAPDPQSKASYQQVMVKPSPAIAAAAQAVAAGRSGWPRVAILLPDVPLNAPEHAVAKALFYDVAHALSQQRTFIVLAPHSSFAVRHDGGLPDDNRTLRADFTLSGLWKPVGSGPRLMVRLVDYDSQSIIWSTDVSLAVADLQQSFAALTGMLVRNVAAEVERAVLRSGDRFKSAPAYAAYLAGCSELMKFDLPFIRRARRAFAQALEHDRRSGLAAARLAQTFLMEWSVRHGVVPEALAQAKVDVEASLKLDEANALGHCVLGAVNLNQRAFDTALNNLAQAETLAPNDADIVLQHAEVLSHCGESDAAWQKLQHAMAINPMPPDPYLWTGASISFDRSDYETTLAVCGRMNNTGVVLRLLAATHALLGNRTEAAEYYQQAVERAGSGVADNTQWVPDKPGTNAEWAALRFRDGLRLAREFNGGRHGNIQ